MPGESAASVGVDGTETFAVRGLHGDIVPGQQVTIEATNAAGGTTSFGAMVRVDGPAEVAYMRAGGVLHLVLSQMLRR
jgi:aconitate hydratase